MKTLLAVTLSVGGSGAFAQVPTPKNITIGYNSEFRSSSRFQQESLLEGINVPAKKEIFELVVQGQDVKLQINRKLNDNLKSALGSEGVGGGNGLQGSDGKITPLDVVFAQKNKPIDIRQDYPAGYKYFEKQVDKIAKVIPSFANDIETEFSRLKWIGTELDLNDSNGCLNNLGIFKVPSREKQVVLACQNSDSEVTLNLKAIRLLKNPEYLGVVFLHEVFVKSLLTEYKPAEYPKAEFLLISKVVPYIFTNPTLNPEKLYEYAQVIGFVRGYINRYSIEVFEDRRTAYEQERTVLEKEQADMKALEDRHTTLEPMIQELLQMKFNRCDESVGTFMLAYNKVREAHRQFTVDAEKLSKSAVSVSNQARASVMASDVREAMIKMERDYDSTMGYDRMGYVPCKN
jgi:hypothetical protein